ncbi:MAG: MarR family transcriptional regulator [Lachnospiraceae bacterium]|nr:MarR family transcriptional regulator [Lachnospiraceae bacterium]
METPIILVLAAFNRAHKRMNVLYHNYAKDAGISDAAFWLMYSLYEKGGPCTQTELCEAWLFAPQTINSALKSLEKQGLITMELAPNSRKNKQFFFTGTGEQLVKEKIIPLIHAEEQSFLRLNEQERNALLVITQKHIDILEKEINKII